MYQYSMAINTRSLHTYPYFLQERVTDHRLGLSLMNLSSVMEGDGLGELVEAALKGHHETLMEAAIQDS